MRHQKKPVGLVRSGPWKKWELTEEAVPCCLELRAPNWVGGSVNLLRCVHTFLWKECHILSEVPNYEG